MHNPTSLDVSVLDPVSGTRKELNRLCIGLTFSLHNHVGAMPFSPWHQLADVVFLHQYLLQCDEYTVFKKKDDKNKNSSSCSSIHRASGTTTARTKPTTNKKYDSAVTVLPMRWAIEESF
jgi:hypothetical protein